MKEELIFTGIIIAIIAGLFAGCLGGIVGGAVHSFNSGIILAVVFGALMLFVKGSPIYA
jgi:hypothetical protein